MPAAIVRPSQSLSALLRREEGIEDAFMSAARCRSLSTTANATSFLPVALALMSTERPARRVAGVEEEVDEHLCS